MTYNATMDHFQGYGFRNGFSNCNDKGIKYDFSRGKKPRGLLINLPQILITLCMLGNCLRFYCRLTNFYKINFCKISFRNTIRVSNGLDPDQDRRSVGPDLGPNCLQNLSADDKNRR